MSNKIGAGALGTSLKAMCGVNEPVVLMNKQVVFHPQDSGSDSIKAKVEIEKNYNGATLKAGVSFGGDRSLLGEMLREFAGEFMIKVEKEEEINDARITLDEFHKFVSEFVLVTEKALDMYPEMAKKEEKSDGDWDIEKLKKLITMESGKDHYGYILTEYLEKKTLEQLTHIAAEKCINLGNLSKDKDSLVFVIAKSSLESWENELPAGTDDNEAIAEFIIG